MVCTGNICRSPMAEGLLRQRFAARGKGLVESAGIAALAGRPADPLAVEVLAERGLDISPHRARQLTGEMILAADLVLVMEEGQKEAVEAMHGSARGRIHRLGKFGGFDVPDPFRLPRPAFDRALSLILQGIDDFDRAFWGGK